MGKYRISLPGISWLWAVIYRNDPVKENENEGFQRVDHELHELELG